ncbi:Alpha/beta hydrolase [Rhodovastum atsumiense]|uniref:Alpha/beta hydrolase n=1 Tax=Rhodovastum atsumiense TaxID=504468 RepID=A0A5M6IM94_9PROT|nr:alpha/beta hydrolase [Rhodovastum atsumiense]KAA5609413.1 alpha/beta hydrolase [Rhodovastum atsumiense]CAH2601828.1 Alpha/beta hydrolase [Rhodovastum atsumiense]
MDPSRRKILAGSIGFAALAAGTGTAFITPRARAAAVTEATRGTPTATDPREPFLVQSSDGTMLAGDAQGDPLAPEILFIHGLRQSRLSWQKQVADPVLAGFRLVRFDLRGHGDSDKPAAPDAYSDADRWADDVAAVIAGAKLRQPVLVGWSLGGYVAGAYLRKHGGARVAGINLVDAVTRLSPDLLTPLAATFTRRATSQDLAERTAATAEFLAACFHQPPADVELLRMLVVNGMTPRAVNEGFVATATTDLEPVFRDYAGPVLLTHGAHDRLVRLAMSERIKALHHGTRLSLFEQSGHSPFYEEPARFNHELAAFVTAAIKG